MTVISRGALAVERAVRQSDVDFLPLPASAKNAQNHHRTKNKLGSVTDLDLKGEKTEKQTNYGGNAFNGICRDEIIQTLENLDASETLEEKNPPISETSWETDITMPSTKTKNPISENPTPEEEIICITQSIFMGRVCGPGSGQGKFTGRDRRCQKKERAA